MIESVEDRLDLQLPNAVLAKLRVAQANYRNTVTHTERLLRQEVEQIVNEYVFSGIDDTREAGEASYGDTLVSDVVHERIKEVIDSLIHGEAPCWGSFFTRRYPPR